jgi:hypothetical protein
MEMGRGSQASEETQRMSDDPDYVANKQRRWKLVSKAIRDLNDALAMVDCKYPIQIVLHPRDRLAVSMTVPFDVRVICKETWPEFQWDGVVVTYQDVFLERSL